MDVGTRVKVSGRTGVIVKVEYDAMLLESEFLVNFDGAIVQVKKEEIEND